MNPKLLAFYNRLAKGQPLTEAECREIEALESVEMRSTEQTLERRILVCDDDLVVRDADKVKFPNSPGTISGRFTKYNALSIDLGGFKERVIPGAFTESLANTTEEYDVRALVSHNKERLIGRRSANTLEIRDDKLGPKFDIYLVDTTECRDAYTNTQVKNYRSTSFGFKAKAVKWLKEGSQMIRELHKVKLAEISLVAGTAAYPNTELAARELTEFVANPVQTPISLLRLRRQALELRGYGDLACDTPSPSYGSVQDQANQASYAAASATRVARTGDANSQEDAAKAHAKAAKLHQQAAKTAPAHHEALADEHKAMCKMHGGKC